MRELTPIEAIQADHRYILVKLYAAQKQGSADMQHEEYWRGALKGIESAMDALGIEHEQYDPLHG